MRPTLVQPSTEAAHQIGAEYRKGLASYHRTGELLRAEKAKHPHGAWKAWVETNREALGFSYSTAARLMAFAKVALTRHLQDPDASSKLWSNAEPEEDQPPPERKFTTSNSRDVGTARGPSPVDSVLVASNSPEEDDAPPTHWTSVRELTKHFRWVLRQTRMEPEDIQRALMIALKDWRPER